MTICTQKHRQFVRVGHRSICYAKACASAMLYVALLSEGETNSKNKIIRDEINPSKGGMLLFRYRPRCAPPVDLHVVAQSLDLPRYAVRVVVGPSQVPHLRVDDVLESQKAQRTSFALEHLPPDGVGISECKKAKWGAGQRTGTCEGEHEVGSRLTSHWKEAYIMAGDGICVTKFEQISSKMPRGVL